MMMSSTESPSNLPIPPSIKPTSRARTYRIPNTSDVAAAAGALAGNSNSAVITADSDKNSNTAAPESFLWATREIAALDFLMNVPLQSEKDIVRAGLSGGRWHRHPAKQKGVNFSGSVEVMGEENRSLGVPNSRTLSSFDVTRSSGLVEEEEATMTGTESSFHTLSLVSEHNKNPTVAVAAGGRWWDKLILKDKRFFSAANQQAQRMEQLELEERELERPTESPSLIMLNSISVNGNNNARSDTAAVTSTPSSAAAAAGVPGRRLDGREAVAIDIPDEFRYRSPPLRAVARQAAVREWEIKNAYGTQQPQNIGNHSNTTKRALLDGRVFFSTRKSYPVAIFSTIKYEPKKEASLRRRKQLEELGGGGTQFVLPERDWSKSNYVYVTGCFA